MSHFTRFRRLYSTLNSLQSNICIAENCLWSHNSKIKFNNYYLINVSRYSSVAVPLISEDDNCKLVKNIVAAYNSRFDTDYSHVFRRNKRICMLILKRMKLEEDIINLQEIAQEDKDLTKLAIEEEKIYAKQLKSLNEDIINQFVESLGDFSCADIIMEITPGVGGLESMIFANELLNMYLKHTAYLGFSTEVIEINKVAEGGIRNASLMISGKRAFELLRHEGGVHRVQRIPKTERSGRVHTSVVSVAVMPQPNDIEVEFNPKDLRIEAHRSSGPGGQSVNKTDSAVRIFHLPTGLMTDCQVERSQARNKQLALAKLRAMVYQKELKAQLQKTGKMRREQMGLGLRHEKIRTYNFNQDRITDHRITEGTLYNLEEFMKGGTKLDTLHRKLQEEYKKRLLLEALSNLDKQI